MATTTARYTSTVRTTEEIIPAPPTLNSPKLVQDQEQAKAILEAAGM